MFSIHELQQRYDFQYVHLTPAELIPQIGFRVSLLHSVTGHLGKWDRGLCRVSLTPKGELIEVSPTVLISYVTSCQARQVVWESIKGGRVVGPSPLFDVYTTPELRQNYLVYVSPNQPK